MDKDGLFHLHYDITTLGGFLVDISHNYIFRVSNILILTWSLGELSNITQTFNNNILILRL